MVRAPCCEKMGLKKGPWSAEEDHILINYVQAHGHTNWRALPKQAGLLRCGKSCRLRWTNYLRPDIKRGNFTPQEEHTIFNLHRMLGNRWSAIAARLPGRTDNEIKNVWHTHLKKRLPQNLHNNPKQTHSSKSKKHPVITSCTTHDHVIKVEITDTHYYSTSPPQSQSSSSDDHTSALTTSDININYNNDMSRNINVGTTCEEDNNIEALDDDFWSEVLSADDSAETSTQIPHFDQFPTSNSSSVCHGFSMDFWYHVYTRAEGLLKEELPQL